MYPSSLSRRAISSFIRELGISTWSWSARLALRIRLSMSAIGSVSTCVLLPRALCHARDRAFVRELAQADPTEAELAENGPRTPAAAAARVIAHAVLLRALRLRDQRFLRHYSVFSPSSAPASAMPG